MIRTLRGLAGCSALILMAVAGLGGVAEACSAQDVLDTARDTKNADAYKTARDVAVEFLDSENWPKDATTIDAATGTLIHEDLAVPGLFSGQYFDRVRNQSDPDEWRRLLDCRSQNHGVRRDGVQVASAYVRDHARLHVREWVNVNSGRPWGEGMTNVGFLDRDVASPGLENTWNTRTAEVWGAPVETYSEYGQRKKAEMAGAPIVSIEQAMAGVSSAPAPAPAPVPEPVVYPEPAPSVPIAPPAPVAIVHYAG